MGVPPGPAREQQINWADDAYWRTRRLSPAHVLIHDVYLAENPFRRQGSGPWFELYECFNSTLLPDLKQRNRLYESLEVENLSPNRHDQDRVQGLAREYGWMNCLRNKGVQQAIDDPPSFRKCRWIHISSKFTEYLEGCLVALSDWSGPAASQNSIVATLRRLDQCIQQNERFSKHGRYFAPFFEPLSEVKNGGPMLISVPFVDWTTEGTPPALRFGIDPREGLQSTRNTAHMLRSLLQQFYRLEDTREREHNQVFCRYKPWLTDRNLDLKVRRWYGEYPAGLNVDELWVLVIDSRHIVTFSSNQSWKSRWPPLQYASRVAEISFRTIRNSMALSEDTSDYTSYTHAVACLSGALGLMHRSFWSDLPLCLTDRYAGYLSHLQYRLLRSPSAKLVMDLLQVQEELNIIIQLMQQQIELVEGIQTEWALDGIEPASRSHSRASSTVARGLSPPRIVNPQIFPTLKNAAQSYLSDPVLTLLECLRTERTDLCELRDNCNSLINRTIQLVNIRLEDHGKAIMVFTIVTIIFLPLSFVASYFGMNTSDIRSMPSTQRLFWLVAGCLTACIAGFSIFLAFYGSAIVENFFTWKANRQEASINESEKFKNP